jgi:hypothetical protein
MILTGTIEELHAAPSIENVITEMRSPDALQTFTAAIQNLTSAR